MVMERLGAAAKLTENQDPTKQFAIEQAKRFLRDAKVKDPGPKEQNARIRSSRSESKTAVPEINLDAEWQRQAGRRIELGFHTEIGLSEEDYLASLPKFEPQPEAFRGRFDIPVFIETRIAPKRQAELAGLTYYLSDLNVRDWEDDPKGYKTPANPYATWMQDGKKNLNKSVSTVRKNLAPDERGATEIDGISLFIANPEILKDHYIDFPGTSVGADYAPYLSRWGGGPEVSCGRVDFADSSYGSASCGRV